MSGADPPAAGGRGRRRTAPADHSRLSADGCARLARTAPGGPPVELMHRDRIVKVKIVYYGPAVGGKTTNLQMLHAAAQEQHRGEFISVNSAQDRTILFDLLPLKGMGFHGFEVRFQVVAVPGQAPYAATRRLVTQGADAIVFVANSARDRLEENLASFREMADHLVVNQIDPGTIPMVLQYNKRDLPNVTSLEDLDQGLNYRDVPSIPAVAIHGEGVLETLGAVLEQTMEHLIGRYRTLALTPGETVRHWTWQTLQRVFGRSSIARRDKLEPQPVQGDGRRIVRVSVPRVPRRVATRDSGKMAAARPTAALPTPARGLAEPYIQASIDLSLAVDRMRDERNEARRRLEELEHTLRAIEAMEDGQKPEEALRAALQQLTVGGSCRGATLIGAAPDRGLRVVAAVGFERDPFLSRPGGETIVRQRFIPLKAPMLVETEKLGASTAPTADGESNPLKGVAVVPVRSALGLHGLGLLYYDQADPLPSPAILEHLGHMGRVLAAWFSVRRAVSMRASTESVRRTLPQIERAARSAGELVRQAARNPVVAAGALEKAERTLDGVATLTAELLGSAGPPAAKSPGGR